MASGSLVRVLPDWMPQPRHVYAVWTQRRYLPARVRVLLEHLAAFAAGNPLLNEDASADQLVAPGILSI
ncbi:LysR substrate binding domain protein [compost metagenome]